ncbi:MAG: hypothetical protein ACYS4W_11120 [Planctomycetota bacterium]
MKRLLILSVVGLAVLAAGSIAASKEGERGHRGHRKMRRARYGVLDANAPGVQDANRPGRHLGEGRRMAFEARMERLESIRDLAVQEKATKTAAALDELLGEEKAQFEKMSERMREWRRRRHGEGGWGRPKGKWGPEGGRRGRRSRGKREVEGDS